MFGKALLAMAVRWPLMDVLALELFHPQANKGYALEYFAGMLGVESRDCIAAGDDVNDLPMIEWAGYGVAMPQAGEGVRQAADLVLKGDGANALAGFLSRLVPR